MWNTLNANMVIVMILAMSILANAVFSSTSTRQWWKDRQVVNYLGRIGVGSNTIMAKTVYLQDVHDAWTPALSSDEPENAW